MVSYLAVFLLKLKNDRVCDEEWIKQNSSVKKQNNSTDLRIRVLIHWLYNKKIFVTITYYINLLYGPKNMAIGGNAVLVFVGELIFFYKPESMKVTIKLDICSAQLLCLVLIIQHQFQSHHRIYRSV